MDGIFIAITVTLCVLSFIFGIIVKNLTTNRQSNNIGNIVVVDEKETGQTYIFLELNNPDPKEILKFNEVKATVVKQSRN